jgi:V8-like Glu-specific endopeptidase
MVTVCGYPTDSPNSLKQHYESNFLEINNEIGCYDINTVVGQSGSPVYFMDTKVGSCHVVGIHKGTRFSSKE